MLSTLVRRVATPNISQSLKSLLNGQLPPSLGNRPGNLYEVLSRTPSGGIGKEVHQLRWSKKQIAGSYWKVTRTKFKCEGKHGRAWGLLYWKGRLVNRAPEEIPGGLKYLWREGVSRPTQAIKN